METCGDYGGRPSGDSTIPSKVASIPTPAAAGRFRMPADPRRPHQEEPNVPEVAADAWARIREALEAEGIEAAEPDAFLGDEPPADALDS